MRLKITSNTIFILLLLAVSFRSYAQQEAPVRQVNHNVHTWMGLFTTHRLTDNWGVTGDFLIRRDNFLSNPGFYFLRLGGGYWFNDNVSLTGAYSNLWLYRPQLKDRDFTLEYRFDKQLIVMSKLWKFNVTQRFRSDSRWREVVVGDQTKGRTFSERIRYLYTFRLPLSKNPYVPQPVFTNEILLQFGKDIVVNPLDQIRVFVGFRQSLGHGLAYDFGYFQIFQQTSAGNIYNANHTLRLLIYFSTRRSKPDINDMPMDGEE